MTAKKSPLFGGNALFATGRVRILFSLRKCLRRHSCEESLSRWRLRPRLPGVRSDPEPPRHHARPRLSVCWLAREISKAPPRVLSGMLSSHRPLNGPLCCESFFPLQHSKTPRTPNLSKTSDCFWGSQSGGQKFEKNLSKFEKP